jgi:ribosomal protein S18 acetylase RimI-like enzyme
VNVSIRPATADDIPFIFNSWLKAYKHSSLFAKRIKHEVFFKYHHAVIERILARGAKVFVATPIHDPDTIIGYCVAEQLDVTTLHFIYVKSAFRRFGVGRQLALSTVAALGAAEAVDFTHWTRDMDWAAEKLPSFTYNPYKI